MQAASKNTRRAVIAGMIGNGMEWYDYALYGQFAAIIGLLFFPAVDKTVSLLATLGVFAAGFIMRPLGAVFFGVIGDRYGRRFSLTLSIFLMAIPTAMIGLLPTYASIGVWAPICLTLIRLLQGFSLGGEMSGSMTYVTEHASQQHRGLAACTSFLSMVLGILLGLLVASICVYGLDDAELKAWGWRLPFLFGIFTCAVGVYIRTKLDESALYKAARDSGGISKTPLHDVIKLHKRELFVSMGIVVSVTIPFYTLTVFMLNYMSGVLHYKIEEALISNALALLVLVFFIPISAFVSDKIGRKPVLLCGVFGFIFFSYPAFYLLEQPDWQKAVIAQMFFAVWVGIYLGAAAAAMVEMFPTRVRFTGLAISYNLCIAIFGATAPIIMTWLATSLGDLVVSSWYVIGGAVVTLIALFFYREKRYAELL